MTKKKTDIAEDKVKLYDDLIASVPEIPRKGAANPYTSHNGHMFSFLNKDGSMALRLPKEEREAFMKKYGTELAISYNTVMKEYAVVPDELLADIKKMKPYLIQSLEYIKTLKPKPTTKKKK